MIVLQCPHCKKKYAKTYEYCPDCNTRLQPLTLIKPEIISLKNEVLGLPPLVSILILCGGITALSLLFTRFQ